MVLSCDTKDFFLSKLLTPILYLLGTLAFLVENLKNLTDVSALLVGP